MSFIPDTPYCDSHPQLHVIQFFETERLFPPVFPMESKKRKGFTTGKKHLILNFLSGVVQNVAFAKRLVRLSQR